MGIWFSRMRWRFATTESVWSVETELSRSTRTLVLQNMDFAFQSRPRSESCMRFRFGFFNSRVTIHRVFLCSSADYIIGNVFEDFFDRALRECPKRLFGPGAMHTGLVVGVIDPAVAHHEFADLSDFFFRNVL